MKSGLTEREMGAVLELIQLSSGCAGGFPVLWVDFPAEKDGKRQETTAEEKSTGESLSSAASLIESDISASGEALPRIRKRFRSLADIYRKTPPSTVKGRRAKKSRGPGFE